MPLVNFALLSHFDGEWDDDFKGGIAAESFDEVQLAFAQRGFELAHAMGRGAGPQVIEDFVRVSAQLQPAINDIGTLASLFVLSLGGVRSMLRRRAQRVKKGRQESQERVSIRVAVTGFDRFYVQGDTSLMDLDEAAFQAMLRGLRVPGSRFRRGRSFHLLWRDGAFWLRLD